MQAGHGLRSPWLAERQRGEKDPAATLPDADHCVLGHGHLTLKDTLALRCPEAPRSPVPSSPLCCAGAALLLRGESGQPISGRGMILADVKDNGGYHSNISACSGRYVF